MRVIIYPMTVCVAAIYGKNQGIVAVADKMFTNSAGILTVHEVNENNKIAKLNKTTIAMLAGNVANAAAIIEELAKVAKDTDKVADIANKAAEIYQKHYKNAVENVALSRWGMNRDEFIEKQQSLDKDLVNNLNAVIADSSLDVQLIIAGKDSQGPSLYVVENPGTVNCLNAVGNAIIGSGGAHASLSMVDSRIQKSDSLGRSLFILYKSKKRAEYDPNVGKYTSVTLIKDSVKELTDDEIKALHDEYESYESTINDTITSISDKIRKAHDGNTSTKK